MATGSIPTHCHQMFTNNHQQGEGQRPNRTPRPGGQAKNDERGKGMQHSGMTFNKSQDTYLLFAPEPTGVRPPKSDITQYQDARDRAINKPRVSDRPTNHREDNPAPNPPPRRRWNCCQEGCEERGGWNFPDYEECPLCGHQRCFYCSTINTYQPCDARQ